MAATLRRRGVMVSDHAAPSRRRCLDMCSHGAERPWSCGLVPGVRVRVSAERSLVSIASGAHVARALDSMGWGDVKVRARQGEQDVLSAFSLLYDPRRVGQHAFSICWPVESCGTHTAYLRHLEAQVQETKSIDYRQLMLCLGRCISTHRSPACWSRIDTFPSKARYFVQET